MHHTRSTISFFASIIAALASPTALGDEFFFSGIGSRSEGVFAVRVNSVSSDGNTVVGAFITDIGGSSWRAFRWTRSDGPVRLGPDSVSEAFGVSSDGSTVVGFVPTPGQPPARWQSPDWITDHFITNSMKVGEVYDVSTDSSVFVGFVEITGGRFDAFSWSESSGLDRFTFQSRDSFARAVSGDGTVVVGVDGVTPFRRTEQTGMIEIPGTTERNARLANDVSEDGTAIVGMLNSSTGAGSRAFRWTESEGTIDLGILPSGHDSEALAVSGDGSVVVGWSDRTNPNGSQAVIWDAEHGLRRLADVLTDDYGIDLTGWNLIEATGISSDGLVIVGSGSNVDQELEGWIACLRPECNASIPTVSETGLAIMVIALLAVGGFLICQRRHHAN